MTVSDALGSRQDASHPPVLHGPLAPLPRPTQAAHLIQDEAEALSLAQQWADTLRPDALQRDLSGQSTVAELNRFSASGLWAINVPRSQGGPGLSTGAISQVLATIASADASLARILQGHLVAVDGLQLGTPKPGGLSQDRSRRYAEALHGLRFAAPEAGMAAHLGTRAARLRARPDGWFIDGRLRIAGAAWAHRLAIPVLHEDAGEQTLALVFIPRAAPGLSLAAAPASFGLRASGWLSPELAQTRIDPDWVQSAGPPSQRSRLSALFARLLQAAIDLGIARGALAAALPFIRERARPWIDSGLARASDDPLLLHEIGLLQARIRAAEALLARAAIRLDDARESTRDNKLNTARGAQTTATSASRATAAVAAATAASAGAGLLAANKLLELTGAGATVSAQGFDRYWRDVRAHSVRSPRHEDHREVGADALGGPAQVRAHSS